MSYHMTEARYNQLMGDSKLTQEEIDLGWHFCNEFDGLVVGPGMLELKCCSCLPKEQLANLMSGLPKDYESPTPGWPGDGTGEDDLADYNQREGDDYP